MMKKNKDFPRLALAAASLLILCLGFSTLSLAVESTPITNPTPTTTPAATDQSASDSTLQWIISQSPDAPATQSSGEPSDSSSPSTPAQPPATKSPFAHSAPAGRLALIHLSDGSQLLGQLDTTPGKPLRLWDEQAKVYRDIPIALIASIHAQVVWERLQPEWHFAASGSDVKEFTGKTYPDRELVYVLTLLNGQTLTGGIVAPLYFRSDALSKTLTLNKRDKGIVGQSLDDLVYVQSVQFDPDPASTQPITTQPATSQPASTHSASSTQPSAER